MYRDSVKTLPLRETVTELKIRVTDEEGRTIGLPSGTLVEEVCQDISDPENPFLPDFAVRGIYHYYDQRHKMFMILPSGPDILYITGLPLEISPEAESKFRLPNPKWLCGAKDNNNRYLFQIIPEQEQEQPKQ